ncbi:O-antigen ligase family protein [Rubellicoccus peritrichatus]|uniref:O-antigen ligase n=1 Tax=Rubellicoccus peritrichatus TaxID=3080537 RepID=A0AAQ3LAS3_9BACT|nr:O-antigen ligase family protein [Puniceicoccus sp. CR14]WOO42026.1 hypothetical protein RZN69_02925 [Puniceicoccus sp. CR14]
MDAVKFIIKALVIIVGYLGIAPTLGYLMVNRPWLRKFLLAFIAFMVVRPPGNFTLMLYSVDWYRGHTKGFEFNFLEIICIGFIIAGLLEKPRGFKLLTPGIIIYLGYCFASLLSIVASYNGIFVLMGFFKFTKIAFIMVGVANAIRDENDLQWLLRGFAMALFIQAVVCLKMRYIDGYYQISAWFEHQNPMAMWSYMVGLILLAVALSKDIRGRDALIYFSAFAAAGICIVFSVSRASLAAFAAGTIALLSISLLRGVTPRRLAVLLTLTAGGSFVLLMAMDTLISRFDSAADNVPENDLRWILNQQARAMLNDSPVGIGWNNFGVANSRPVETKYSRMLEQWNAKRGHTIVAEHYYANPLTESHYWLLLAETGYLSLICFLLFALATLYWCLRGIWTYRRSFLGFLLLGIGMAFAITYLHSNLERVLTQTKNLTTWMILVGVIARIELWRRSGKITYQKGRGKKRISRKPMARSRPRKRFFAETIQ